MLAPLTALTLLCVGTVLGQSSTMAPPSTTLPPADLETELIRHGGYTRILDLLRQTGLLDVLKQAPSITLFAPTDAAFNRLTAAQVNALVSDPTKLKNLLGYHAALEDVKELHRRPLKNAHDIVVDSSTGQPIRINVYSVLRVVAAEGVKITERSVRLSNGYVHGIDGIMTPPEGDVVDIASKTNDLSTLVSFLTSAGLVDAIKADQNITVFAPNNAAFAKLDPAVANYLATHPMDLEQVLLYHVVGQTTLYSIGMRHTQTFHTADRRHDNLMVLEDFATGEVKINTAKIVVKDISATNGVIHIIDEVLVPVQVLLKIEKQGLTIG